MKNMEKIGIIFSVVIIIITILLTNQTGFPIGNDDNKIDSTITTIPITETFTYSTTQKPSRLPSTPQATPTLTQLSSPVSLTPEPTQTLPDNLNIEIEVKSNGMSINPLIITTFRGGKGRDVIQRIDVKVTRSDGIVETGSITQVQGSIPVGKNVELTGTNAPGYRDRAEVWVISSNGDVVKIFDAYIPFRSYN